MSIPKPSFITGVLDAHDEQDTLVNAAGHSRIVGFLKVGKEFLKSFVEIMKESSCC